ncbi:hypothetical protein EV426DRAFT_712284 [Tirmania nivea]|nr:hypothetical protein EV426DRAFT_712284 [Tirmania nivea]
MNPIPESISMQTTTLINLQRNCPVTVVVTASSQMILQWSHTLDTDLNTGLVIDASHNGPIMAYMAKVGSATGAIPNSGWFKVYEAPAFINSVCIMKN